MVQRYCIAIIFCAVTILVYFQAMKNKREELQQLHARLSQMEWNQQIACVEQEEYLSRIASQTDASWIEMVLMRDLGVVPEGFLKVHFKK